MDFSLQSWVNSAYTSTTRPPFEMKINGQPISTIWNRFSISQADDIIREDQILRDFIYTDNHSGIKITLHLKLFPTYDAIDAVMVITNTTPKNSPVLSEIQVFDLSLFPFLPNGTEHLVHHSRGSNAGITDFEPMIDPLRGQSTLKFHPRNGRSSNTKILPFFAIETSGVGAVFVGIGWSGQWASNITQQQSGIVELQVGMEHTHLYLESHETIRTPRILLVPWRGQHIIDGHNLFRRFLMQYYIFHPQNTAVHLPLAFYGCRGFWHAQEANYFTEANQIEFSNKVAQFQPEVHWIDAGWFEGRWPNGVGSWIVRKDGFPHGLRPIAENDRKNGMKLLVWFELERVHKGSWVATHHPEFCLQTPMNSNRLFDLGNPAARQWLIAHITDLIRENGIGLFRLDFNRDPLKFWQRADAINRQGIHEIRHIEGLYEFWDELHRQFPDMLTDNCASGGRRIDLESISRNVILTRTDYRFYEPTGPQCHTHAINLYLPSTATFTNEAVPYKFRSVMTNGVMLTWDPFKPEFNAEFGKKLLDEFQAVRDLYLKDFYPLSPYSPKKNVWCVYQFHDPQTGRGMVVAFRRQRARQATYSIQLQGVEESKTYDCESSSERLERQLLGKISGATLRQGYTLTIPTPKESLLFRYSVSPS
jgi:alpha-galactosidase